VISLSRSVNGMHNPVFKKNLHQLCVQLSMLIAARSNIFMLDFCLARSLLDLTNALIFFAGITYYFVSIN
jgi:hypothetical protein